MQMNAIFSSKDVKNVAILLIFVKVFIRISRFYYCYYSLTDKIEEMGQVHKIKS